VMKEQKEKKVPDCSASLGDVDDLMVRLEKADAVGETTVRVVELLKPDSKSGRLVTKCDKANRVYTCSLPECQKPSQTKLMVCPCRAAYCNRECQKAHWRRHKVTCSHRKSVP
jgi:hypothetical protein